MYLRKWSRINAQYVWFSDVPWRCPRLRCSTIRSFTSYPIHWVPSSIVTWASFSSKAVNPPSFLPHLYKIVPFFFFGTTLTLNNIDFAVFCLLLESWLCWKFLQSVSFPMLSVSLDAVRFPSAVFVLLLLPLLRYCCLWCCFCYCCFLLLLLS